MRNDSRGFTLVEILVAVAVVAFALTALLSNMGKHIDGSVYLREKTFAHWVALNQLELVQIKHANTGYVPPSRDSGREELAGREWFWQLQSQPSDDKMFLRLELRVFSDPDMSDEPVVFIEGAIDNFEAVSGPLGGGLGP